MAAVLVTGASGQIGSRLCSMLRRTERDVVGVDVRPSAGVERCDLRNDTEIRRVFDSREIQTVIHLAGVLPSASRADPVAATRVNITATMSLLSEAVAHHVERFVFASSLSVYGSAAGSCRYDEDAVTNPDEPYGAAKRLVELVGENLAARTQMDFVSLRIARVLGPGATNTASAWRAEIFERLDSVPRPPIVIPFAGDAVLSVVHVDEVAKMLEILSGASVLPHHTYNTPVEEWTARQLGVLVQRVTKREVRLGEATGGPRCEGARFAEDFGFALRGVKDYLG